MKYHLAQANIGKTRAPMDSPIMRGFVEQLASINAIADAAPGFVWRLQTEGTNNATELKLFPDPLIIINMSVWESIEALKAYVYIGSHSAVLRDRSKWFERLNVPQQVMWWIEEGHIPTVEDAKERLAKLAKQGPSPDAFTFKTNFPSP